MLVYKTNSQRILELQDLVIQFIQDEKKRDDLFYYLECLKQRYDYDVDYSRRRRVRMQTKKEEEDLDLIPLLKTDAFQTLEQIYLGCRRRGLNNNTVRGIGGRLNRLIKLGLVQKKQITVKGRRKIVYRLLAQEQLIYNAEQKIIEKMEKEKDKKEIFE